MAMVCRSNLERLKRFYSHYAPKKVATAELALELYAGREEALFRALEQKYGPEEDIPRSNFAVSPTLRTIPLPSKDSEAVQSVSPLHFHTTRSRLERFYAFYCPENLESIELTLKSYKGREDMLFRLLQQKYGPEPSVFTPIRGEMEHAKNAGDSTRMQMEIKSFCGPPSPDFSAALLQVEFPPDSLQENLSVYSPNREQYTALTALIVTLIGDALFDTNEDRRIIFPYHQLEQLTGVAPNGLHHLAFEHILAYRRTFLSFISGMYQVQQEEAAERSSILDRLQSTMGRFAYKSLVLQEALICLPFIEDKRRNAIAKDEQQNREVLLAWRRQRRRDILVEQQWSSTPARLQTKDPSTRRVSNVDRKVSRLMQEEGRCCVVERWEDRTGLPFPKTSYHQSPLPKTNPLPRKKELPPARKRSAWRPVGVHIKRSCEAPPPGSTHRSSLSTPTPSAPISFSAKSQKRPDQNVTQKKQYCTNAHNTDGPRPLKYCTRLVSRGAFSPLAEFII